MRSARKTKCHRAASVSFIIKQCKNTSKQDDISHKRTYIVTDKEKTRTTSKIHHYYIEHTYIITDKKIYCVRKRVCPQTRKIKRLI